MKNNIMTSNYFVHYITTIKPYKRCTDAQRCSSVQPRTDTTNKDFQYITPKLYCSSVLCAAHITNSGVFPSPCAAAPPQRLGGGDDLATGLQIAVIAVANFIIGGKNHYLPTN
jgi:hypothetical protein